MENNEKLMVSCKIIQLAEHIVNQYLLRSDTRNDNWNDSRNDSRSIVEGLCAGANATRATAWNL